MPSPPSVRERLSLDAGWRFHRGDIPFPRLISHSDCYNAAKAGKATGAAAPAYDDTAWQTVNVPHDWAVENPYVEDECLSQGFRARGFGWYRRHFRLDPADRGRHLELQFDGIATHCAVWVNGSIVHRNWCGYTGWSVDLTPFAKYGEELNTVAIRVDADAMEGWWYEGAGIYRHTWLVKRAPVHLVTDGVYANPVRSADGAWSIPFEAVVANSGLHPASVEVVATLHDPEGRELVSGRAALTVDNLCEETARFTLSVDAPRLWHVDAPVLYAVRTEVRRDGAVVDAVETACGFRTLRFDADHGFFLNDLPLKLQGVCNHQDHAGVGVAVPDSLHEWRLVQLKKLGVNAYRVAHNPSSSEFLDLCDRLGILVMDENRHFNSSGEYVRQLEWLVKRDRNHPSVFMWSVFNEEPMQGAETGFEMVCRMAAVVKKLDATRPVTAAMNGGLFSPVNVSQAVDVVGFNYQIESYDRFHAANPTMRLTSSEDTSAYMTRGAFESDLARNIRNSYDTEYSPWGASHRGGWRAIVERPFLAGGFVWTGFDYHGEPTPHSWPSCSSFFGILDLCGFPKVAAHMHRAHWRPDTTVLEIAPHWNWPGREGRPVTVLVITNAPRAALSLDGVPLGEKPVDPLDFASWEVPYAAGRLEAVALDAAGREIARTAVETAGEPVALELVADRPALAGDGCDAQPVAVRALDAQGRPVPTANFPVRFSLEGPAAIIGLGNGDPNCHEPEKGDRRSLFNGLAQVVVQSLPASSGECVLRAAADGLRAAELRIALAPVAPRPAVPSADPILFLQAWRTSPLSDTRLDPNLVVADNDMNTWPNIQPGELQTFVGGRCALYRSTFTPFASHQRDGARLAFTAIVGVAEVWVNGACLARKPDPAPAPLVIALPPGAGPREITLLIETAPGVPAGLGGSVSFY